MRVSKVAQTLQKTDIYDNIMKFNFFFDVIKLSMKTCSDFCRYLRLVGEESNDRATVSNNRGKN